MSDNAGTQGPGGMIEFDKLPKRVREALAEFPLNMSSEFPLQAIKHGVSEDKLLAQLEALRVSQGLPTPLKPNPRPRRRR